MNKELKKRKVVKKPLGGILKADIAGISLVAIPKIHVSGSVGPISIFIDLFKTPLVLLWVYMC